MLGQQFYHESIRNVIVAFGTMFNNVQIIKEDKNTIHKSKYLIILHAMVNMFV